MGDDRPLSFTEKREALSRSLVKAIKTNDSESIRKILGRGADPNLLLAPEGFSPMHFFLGPQNKYVLTCADLLIRFGGNPNVRSAEGLTPIHVCAAWGRSDVLKLLLKYGGDPNVRDDDGNCPFSLAHEHGHYDVVDILEQHFYSSSKSEKSRAVDARDERSSSHVYETLASDTFSSESKSNSVNVGLDFAFLGSDWENFTLETRDDKVSKGDSTYFTADVAETDSWYTVDEYLCIDSKENAAFVERKLLPSSCGDSSLPDCSAEVSDRAAHILNETVESHASSVTTRLNDLADEIISQRLKSYGDVPGPITAGTRRVYLRRLKRLCKEFANPQSKKSEQVKLKAYSPQLHRLMSAKCAFHSYESLEDAFLLEYANPNAGFRLRGGVGKSCFNYLLLDPRVSNNLPQRAGALTKSEALSAFVAAIFYVGKGKQARTYDHLYEALRASNQLSSRNISNKVKRILEIWKDGYGVVSMHCFYATIAAEAFTREACIIDAIGIENLTNERVGNHYGQVARWPRKDKCKLGSAFLQRALAIFLQEGERQIHSVNVVKRNGL